MMRSVLASAVLFVLVHCLLAEPIHQDDNVASQDFKQYKFLYFAFEKLGSHGMQLSQSGKVLARQGHKVTYLLGSDGPRMPKINDEDFFSFVIFRSRYTAEDRRELLREVSHACLTGQLSSLWGIAGLIYESIISGKQFVVHMIADECDALLGDKETMERLRQERFDMLVADDFSLCNPILAQALEIPFVQAANWGAMPERYGSWFGVPADPSYIPGRTLRFTDRMTLSQRVKNFLWQHISGIIMNENIGEYQKQKVKYNIKPEIDMVQSLRQAKLWFFNMNYPLEFPRPLHPNTIMAPPMFRSVTNETVADDVTEFLDTASSGVVLFSFGSHIESMATEQAQMFADGFAMLPQRVLWQSSADLSKVTKGENTKVVRWIPLAQLMTHKNVKALVTHGGINCVIEAIWAGIPIVGIPLAFDQFDNVDRAAARGFGISLDITEVTSESLRRAISRVVTNTKFQENAQQASLIMKDLTDGTPPAEIVAHWILHVTKFGGDHLRPAVLDLSFVERNLLDVYLILLLFIAAITGAFVMLCYICCSKCRRFRPKQD